MADVKKTVEIIFGGKNEVSKIITDISRDFNTLGDLTSKITDPLAAVGQGILKIDAALALLAIGGLAVAVKESSDFNKSFALITTSIDATGKDLEKYRNDVLNYSTTSVKSISDINASLYTAAQAGVKWADSLDFIRKAEELAVANNANLNTTVDLLTGTMNAYGFKMGDLGRLNDIFFTSTLIGKQTIDQLGQSMGQVMGIAANSGVSFEELSTAIATLTAKTMQTPDAITAVKNVITSIISPSKEAAEAAGKLGLNFSLTELTSKGFAGMLAEIMKKTGGSKEKIVELFNEVRAMNGVLSLTGDGMKFFNNALKETINSTGSSEAAYKKMVNTFSNQTQMIINTAKVTMITIGTILEPMTAKIGGSFGSLLAGVKVAVDAGAFDQLFKALDGASNSIASWINQVSMVLPAALKNVDFSGLITAFRGLASALGEYMGGLDLTKTDDLAGALQTLVDILTGLVNITTGMTEAFRPFVTQIVNFFKELSQGGIETQETVGKLAGFAVALQNLGVVLFSVLLAVDEFGVSMKGLFNIVAGGAQVMWNGFEILLSLIKNAVITIGFLLVEFIDQLTFRTLPLDAMKMKLAEWGSAVSNTFEKNGMEAAQGLARLGQGFLQLGGEVDKAGTKTREFNTNLGALPRDKKIDLIIGGAVEAMKAANDTAVALEKVAAKKEVTINVAADQSKITRVGNAIMEILPDGNAIIVNYGPEIDKKKEKATKDAIAALHGDKTVKLSVQVDEARIKEQSAIIQKAVEWKAKVDIAQVEAGAKILEATFKSVDTSITSTGSTIDSILGKLTDQNLDTGTKMKLTSLLDAESKARQKALELSNKLAEQQVLLNQMRLDKLQNGDATIKVSADGLKPHLEMILWEILEAIQVRASESSSEFLLGFT